jgi:hypothetical protein
MIAKVGTVRLRIYTGSDFRVCALFIYLLAKVYNNRTATEQTFTMKDIYLLCRFYVDQTTWWFEQIITCVFILTVQF